jgi:hypothetical protein
MLLMHLYAISRLTASVFFGTYRPSTRRSRMPTFREWAASNNRQIAWPRRPMTPPGGADPFAYYCPYPEPIYTPSEKRPGDLVLGSGGKWGVVA